jgi:hypothetical protein
VDNWRTLVVNCQSLKNKGPCFAAAVDYIKPDLILGTESWLDSSVKDNEMFPPGYNVYRKDRNLHGGGVFTAVKDCYNSSSVAESDSNCEIAWTRVELCGSQDMFVASFYRPTDSGNETMESLEESLLSLPPCSENKPLILGGDFNLPDILWSQDCIKQGAAKPALSRQLLTIAANMGLAQTQEEPTRGDNTLDLYFTNRPGLIKNSQTVPGIGDHSMCVVDTDL